MCVFSVLVLNASLPIAAVLRLCHHSRDSPHWNICAVCGFPMVLVVVGDKHCGRGHNDSCRRVPLYALWACTHPPQWSRCEVVTTAHNRTSMAIMLLDTHFVFTLIGHLCIIYTCAVLLRGCVCRCTLCIFMMECNWHSVKRSYFVWCDWKLVCLKALLHVVMNK